MMPNKAKKIYRLSFAAFILGPLLRLLRREREEVFGYRIRKGKGVGGLRKKNLRLCFDARYNALLLTGLIIRF
jgi:hypothetical protein